MDEEIKDASYERLDAPYCDDNSSIYVRQICKIQREDDTGHCPDVYADSDKKYEQVERLELPFYDDILREPAAVVLSVHCSVPETI